MQLSFVLMENAAVADDRYEDIPLIRCDEPIDRFLDLFSEELFRGDAVVVNSGDLHNRKAFRIGVDTPYAVVNLADARIHRAVLDACIGSGSMSAYFFPRDARGFLEAYYAYGYYDRLFRRATEEDLLDYPVISLQTITNLRRYLRESGRGDGTVGITFTHDAELLCEVHVCVPQERAPFST